MELQTSTNNGENTSQNNQLAQRKKLHGTPFHIIKQTKDNDEVSYFLVMGDYRLTEPHTSEEELMLTCETEHWNITVNVIAITCEKMIQQIELEKNRKQQTLDLIGFGHIETQKETPYETESL